MANHDADDDFPFLELNEELSSDWAIEQSSSADGSPSPVEHSPALTEDNSAAVPPAFSRLTAAPLPASPRYRLTPTGKALLGLGAGFTLVMVLFRVPPALVLMGLFSAFRVLFFPIMVGGLIWWLWRHRR